jgi:hypothetical protein
MSNKKHKFTCTSCRIESKRKTRNYNVSNWCSRCNTWKPKPQIFCECCKMRMRNVPRNSRLKVEKMRI